MKMFSTWIAVGVALILSTSASAQVTTATIYGTVTDSTRAIIPAASVTATNELTGATASTQANSSGDFTFTFLPVGRYRLAIEAKGFKAHQRTGLELTAGQSLRLPITLEVGVLTESVSVSAEAPLLEATNSQQRQSLGILQVRELPLARRDWTAFMALGTGMAANANQSSGNPSLNGLPTAGLTFTVDGTDASGHGEFPSFGLYTNWNVVKGISTEAIEEVSVTKGIVSAEYAAALSGNVNIISRGGTNEFHGSLFENNQTQHGSARHQVLGAPTPLTFNQFGGSAGGPIVRNKLFYFGVYEGYRLRAFTPISGNVPTPEFRAQALAAVPAYKTIFDILPLPSQPYPTGAVAGFFQGASSTKGGDNHVVGRGDYLITDNSRVSARYTHSRPSSLRPLLSVGWPQTLDGISDISSASYIHARPSWTSETRFGYNSFSTLRTDGPTGQLPGITTTGNLGGWGAGTGGNIIRFFGHVVTLEDSLSVTRGRHALKVGVNYQQTRSARRSIPSDDYTYASVADFLANTPSIVRLVHDTYEERPATPIRFWRLGGYVQDDFRVNPSLILNFGIRYDYFSVPRSASECCHHFNRADAGFGPLRPWNSLYDANHRNFSPRISFAWTADRASQTVIRGGASVTYTAHPAFGGLLSIQPVLPNGRPNQGNYTFTRAEALTYRIQYPTTGRNYPVLLNILNDPNGPWVLTQNTSGYFPQPYAIQYMLSLQRQITKTLALEAAYVGNRGVHFNYLRQLNQVNRLTGIRSVPELNTFNYWDSSESTRYNSLQTSLRKRLSHDLTFDLNYTYANSICYGSNEILQPAAADFPQDPNNIHVERGLAPFDARHRLNGNVLYELPFAKFIPNQGKAVKLLAAGWQIGAIFTAATGQPIVITQPSSLAGSRPDYIGGPAVLGNYRKTLQYLDRAAFAMVPTVAVSAATVRPGTMSRNPLRGPGFWNVDASMAKNFLLTERIRMQLRADFFNSLNHTNLTALSTNINAANFGRLTSTRGARVAQLNARLTW
jgi:hypothetical protein